MTNLDPNASGPKDNFAPATIQSVAHAVQTGDRTARSFVEQSLEFCASTDVALNGFCAKDGERALREADVIDQRVGAGEHVGPLAGVPIGVKDLEPAIGFRTVCGDPARAAAEPSAVDSIEVARLRAAGAIVIGKTNTPAYGFHAETDNLVFGPTRNPWALNRTSGGSSGGSAAVVAAGIVSLCTGSDGGGSIRIPSAVCGISGFKPTHGVVPMGDHDAPTWGPFSTRGPMARTFREVALALDVVKGATSRDLLSFDLPGSFNAAAIAGSLDGVRVIWSETLGVATPDPAILERCRAAVALMEAAGAVVVDQVENIFDTPPIGAWIARAAPGSRYTATRDPMPWDGRFLPAAIATASYGERVTAQQMIEGEAGAHNAASSLADLWDRCDVIVSPGMATVPPRVGEESPYGPGWAAAYTLPFNVVRSPAATVHCGCVDDDGDMLPVSIQLAMPRGADLRLMSIATACEDALGGVPVPPVSVWQRP